MQHAVLVLKRCDKHAVGSGLKKPEMAQFTTKVDTRRGLRDTNTLKEFVRGALVPSGRDSGHSPGRMLPERGMTTGRRRHGPSSVTWLGNVLTWALPCLSSPVVFKSNGF